jgi:protein SCO1
MDRREVLTGSAVRAPRVVSMGPEYYTNAVLRTHENKEVRFYDDLIKDKHVLINFMYTQCEGACPLTTANLLKVQKALGDRVGRDIFMYSISLKGWQDDPAAMAEYAKMHGAGPGWLFLTGDQFDLDTIRFRMFRFDHPGLDFNIEQHTGMIRVINDKLNRWSMFPSTGKMDLMLKAISWVEPTKPYKVRFEENLARQALIDAQGMLAYNATA